MNGDRSSPDRGDYLALAAISAATLAFEILLLRIFALTQWHHFASLAVSLALLGFGAAGTALTIAGPRAATWGDRLFCGGMLGAGLGMAGVLALNEWLQVRPLFIIWKMRELAKVLALNFAAFIPFFCAALAIGLVFVRWPMATRRLYAANMIGSGAGSLAAAALLSIVSVVVSLRVVAGFVLLAGALAGLCRRGRGLAVTGTVCFAGLLAWTGWSATHPQSQIRVSDFSRLAYLLDLPDAKVIRRLHGLRGMVTLIRSDSIRMAPGLSLRWQEAIPAQDALVLDADRAVPLPRSNPAVLGKYDYLQATLGAAPLVLRPGGSALVLGTGEGLAPLRARVQGARRVVWVEPDYRIGEAFLARHSDYGDEWISDDPRRAIARTDERFDLIVLDWSAAGGDALGEETLLTVEGLCAMMGRLKSGGMIAIPLALHNPPRYTPKLLRMIRAALVREGVVDPGRHVLAMRSMQQCLICISHQPFKPSDVAGWRAFARRWEFDLVWTPDMQVEEAEQYHRLGAPVFLRQRPRR